MQLGKQVARGKAKMTRRLMIAIKIVEMAMAHTKTITAMTRKEVVEVVAVVDVEAAVAASMPALTSPTSHPERSAHVSVAYIPR